MCNLVFASFLPTDVLSPAQPIPALAQSPAGPTGEAQRVSLWLVVVAHLVLLLQLVSFVQCQTVHPGAPPLVYGVAAAGAATTVRGGPTADETRGAADETCGAARGRWGGAPGGGGVSVVESGPGATRLCPRTSLQQPERAVWVANAGEMVLGLDHYCFWIGRPIGAMHASLHPAPPASFCSPLPTPHPTPPAPSDRSPTAAAKPHTPTGRLNNPPPPGLRNRKFFILFLAYSSLLCAAGAALTWHEVRHSSTARGRAFLATLAQPGGLDLLLDRAPNDETRSRIRVAAFFARPVGRQDASGAAGKRGGGGGNRGVDENRADGLLGGNKAGPGDLKDHAHRGRDGTVRRGGSSSSHSTLLLPSSGGPWLLSVVLNETGAER